MIGSFVNGTCVPCPAGIARSSGRDWHRQLDRPNCPRLWWFVSRLVVGLVTAWLMPTAWRELAEALRDRPWQGLGRGAVLFVMTPIAAMVALITVGGIPVGLLILSGYAAVLLLSQVFVGLLLGLIILRPQPTEGTLPLLGPLAIGLAVFMIILAVMGIVPVLGGLVVLANIVFGLGAAWIAAGRARLGKNRAADIT